MNPRRLSLRAVFAIPLAVFALSLTGLVGALLRDGAWDWMFSGFLSSTVAVTAWALVRRRR